ncbi:hypothetical protein AHF37_02925 [Paragonimus kellicotti]|nr:hypothetical protein AHF37_02925 [Paragonimus kellicotti]
MPSFKQRQPERGGRGGPGGPVGGGGSGRPDSGRGGSRGQGDYGRGRGDYRLPPDRERRAFEGPLMSHLIIPITQLQAIAAVYQPFRSALTKSAFPGIPELLAVRDNMILRIEKTSGVHGRRYTSCPLNKILIGQVPDRGGRAWELEPPPPEMPSFKQRQPERGGRGGPGGPVGGGGSGRPDSGRGGSRGQGDYGRGRGGGFTHGVQQFRPPTPSAHLGGGDYVVSGSAYAALNQQLSGLAFEPGIAVGQPQGYVFQPINMQDGSYCDGYAPQMRGRGGRGRGNRGRPF